MTKKIYVDIFISLLLHITSGICVREISVHVVIPVIRLRLWYMCVLGISVHVGIPLIRWIRNLIFEVVYL